MTVKRKTYDFSALLFDSRREVIENAAEVLELNPSMLPEVIELCKSSYPISMRAARVIQFYFERHTDEIPYYADILFDELNNTKIDGVKRSFLKTIQLLPQITYYGNAGKVFDICLNWLLSESETIAVKAYSLDLLMKFVSEQPELKNELKVILDNDQINQHHSLKLRCNKFLKR